MSRADAVRIFQVSLGSIKRWLLLRRTSGDLTPQRPSGRTPIITADQHAQLRLQLEAAPDATLAEQASTWNADHDTTLEYLEHGASHAPLGLVAKKRP